MISQITIGERIKELRKHLKMSQTEFGVRIGYEHASAVSKLELGENGVSEQTVKLICREFGVSYGWIKYGHEPMMEPKDSLDMGKIERIMDGDNEYVKAIFRELADMPAEWWEQAIAMLDRVAAQKKGR